MYFIKSVVERNSSISHRKKVLILGTGSALKSRFNKQRKKEKKQGERFSLCKIYDGKQTISKQNMVEYHSKSHSYNDKLVD